MNPRITSIENLIAFDPGGRNIFGLVVADQLRLAAQSLRLAKRVAIVSGFYIPAAGAGETDGPPGAKILGEALRQLGMAVDYLTDEWNAPLFRALGIEPVVDVASYLDEAKPTHLVAVERAGRGRDGRYRNMRGVDITATTAPLDELFLEGSRRGLTTIGIGDGGNEIGMGKVFADALATIENGSTIATIVSTDFCIGAGVSNWGAYGLAGAISILEGRDLLPSADSVARDLNRLVREGGAVDGVTHRHEPSSDGQDLAANLRMLEQIRRQIAPSPLDRGTSLLVGILGYGESGAAAARLLTRYGHRVRVSDERSVALDPGMVVERVEAGGHTIEFLERCDLVVASPGVRVDSPILDELHLRGIYVMSSLELAYQIGVRGRLPAASSLIAVTGTIGKRTTVELLQRLFAAAGRRLVIGGNRGRPLSDLLIDHGGDTIALAVSSFQLETVVHFRPHIAVFLNVAEEHLDRHHTIAEYVRIKSRIFMNQRPDDVLILPFDDPRLRRLARKHQGRTLFVSARQAVDRGAWLADGRLWLNLDGPEECLGPVEATYPENVLAAVLAARLAGLSSSDITEALRGERSEGGEGRTKLCFVSGTDFARATPAEIRSLCRANRFHAPTTGVALGYVQANLVILRAEDATDFARFCELNPKPCPRLETTAPGEFEPKRTAPGADVRTDLPRYRVYRGGVCVDRPTSIASHWTDDCVAFLIGCSFTFESAMLRAGLPVRHIERGCNVPMYRTNIPCAPAGRFAGPLVVSMRPMTREQADEAARVTGEFPKVHGAPIQIGDPGRLGIVDLSQPDYGDAVDIRPGEIPVFWACGVTPMEAIMRAKPDLAITHEPGHMFVTDLRDHELRGEGHGRGPAAPL